MALTDAQALYSARIKRVIITKEEIEQKIADLGKYLDSIYDGHPLLLVGILKGCFVFLADVCRAVTVPCEIGFMRAESYFKGTESTGDVKITMGLEQNLSDYHVVILEDIVDTGRTLKVITDRMRNQNPRSFRVVTLLDKPSRRVVDFTPDLSLFEIPDTFVIGYGLDCAELYRNLPYIAEYDVTVQ